MFGPTVNDLIRYKRETKHTLLTAIKTCDHAKKGAAFDSLMFLEQQKLSESIFLRLKCVQQITI